MPPSSRSAPDDHDVLAELGDQLGPLGLEALGSGRAVGLDGTEHLLAERLERVVFETGSVSQPMPTIDALPASTITPTRPSVVARSARFPAAAIPFSRSSVLAASRSPPVS